MIFSPVVFVLLPLGTAFIIPLVDLLHVATRRILVIIAASFSLFIGVVMLVSALPELSAGTFFQSYHLSGWIPPFGITLALDGLGLVFSSLVTLFSFLIIVYSIGFIGHHEGKYYVLLFLFQAGCQGVVMTGDIFNLYVFIELSAITSYALVAFERNRSALEAAIKYMVYGILAGVFIFLGVIMIYRSLGTLNLAEIAAHFHRIPLPVQRTSTVFLLTGILIKLGIFPFHFWMAKVYGSAPASVSALLSGTLAKVNIYIFLRLFWFGTGFNVLSEAGWDRLLLGGALLSTILGHVFALRETEVKRMLAFSSMGNMGIIVAVLSLNTALALYAALIHVIFHALMKTGLFLSAGYFLRAREGSKERSFVGAAYRKLPIFIGFIIFALAMIGLPPLNGFFSKWFTLQAFLEKDIYFAIAFIHSGSVLGILYYLPFVRQGMLGVKRREEQKKFPSHNASVFYHERFVTSVVYILILFVVLSGLLPFVYPDPLETVIAELAEPNRYIERVLGGLIYE